MRWLSLLMAVLAYSSSSAADTLHDGDIIFHTSRSAQSLAIQRATRSPYSHVGLVFHRNGKPYVFEAIATVRYTPLAKWTARGNDGKYVVRRLKTPLSAEQARKLQAAAEKYADKPYDLYFEWSNERIYCSELVWKVYHEALGLELGARQQLKDFHLSDPVVRTKLRERYGRNVPMNEPVISPGAQFDSPLLRTVPQ